MRTKKLSIVALIATLLLASCQKYEYANVIPGDAAVVASIEWAEIADQGEMYDSGVVGLLEQSVGLVVSGKGKEKIQEYIKDPFQMGINFRVPMYMFAKPVPNNYYGLVFSVHSQSKLEEFFNILASQNLCTMQHEEEGRLTGVLLDEICYSFDSSSLLLLASTSKSHTKKMMSQILYQNADQCFVNTPQFEKMNEQDGLIKLYADNSESFPELAGMDVEMYSAVKFDNGKAIMKLNVAGKTAKEQEKINEIYANMKKLDGEFDEKMHDDFLVWASAGVKVDWLLEKIKEDKKSKLHDILFAVERVIDIEQMINTIDGDATVVAYDELKDNPYIFMAEIKNNDFLKDVDYWMESMKEYGARMKNTGGNNYLLAYEFDRLYWGVNNDGDELYFSSESAFNKICFESDSKALEEYKDEIKNCYLFAYVNFDNLPYINSLHGFGAPMLKKILGRFKCLVIKSQQVGEIQVELEMKDKKDNFLKQVLEWN